MLEAFALAVKLAAQDRAGAAPQILLDFYTVRHPATYDYPVSEELLSQPVKCQERPAERKETHKATRKETY